jgi:CRP-like cAMP-binding protein
MARIDEPRGRSVSRLRRARLTTDRNRLIELLPRQDRLELLAICKPVELILSEVLCEPGEQTRHIYFPTEGFISLVTLVKGSSGLEVGMVGCEGMLGASLALGVMKTPLRALVQGTGTAWRANRRDFCRQLAASPALKRGIDRYLYVLMVQLASSAGCLRSHVIASRLARWLLMSQDRAHSDYFRVTHEFLAYMLGVRRGGITDAALALQRAGLIQYRRGDMTVLDRNGLERAACACYASDRRIYADVLG